MNSKFKWAFSMVALIFASCSGDEPVAESGYGKVQASFKADYSVEESRASTRSAAPAVVQPEVSEFYVHMSRTDGSVDKTWNKVSEMSQDEEFPIGDYTIETSYGSESVEGFDKPYYYGTASFTIYDREVAQPEVVATLRNTMVSVDYTEAFKNYFADYSTTIHSEGGAYVTFEKTETRAAYVRPGNVSIAMTLTNREGKTINVEPASIPSAQARTHYHITFDVNGGEVGNAVLSITFDDTVVDGGEVDVVIGEDLFSADVPSVNALDFTPGTAFNYSEGDALTVSPRMSMIAMAGFSAVTLTTQSESLLADGWPAEVNLACITPAQKAYLLNKGLKVSGLWGKTASNMALVDFGGVISHLEGGTHSFTLVAKDILSRVTEPVTLTMNISAVTLSIAEGATTKVGSGAATVEVTYSGEDFANNVKLQYQAADGSWIDCTVTGITELGGGKYQVNISLPVKTDAVKVRAVYNGKKTSTAVDVKPVSPTISLACDAVDMWATKAFLTLSTDEGDADAMARLASVYVSTDGVNFSKAKVANVSGNVITVNGLNPGTRYYVKASVVNSVDNASAPIVLTTETNVQLPNSDMESWSKTKLSGSYYKYFPFAEGETDAWWTTNNDRGLDYSVFRVGITSNCAVSFNKDIKHGGNYSAQIYTSGHGGGYASTAQILYPAGAFAGSLFIGSYAWNRNNGETVTTGHAFPSRPSSLSFWYEYMPKNSDQFRVEIEMRAGDEVIARGEYEPVATDVADTDFRKVTIHLNYFNTKKKATGVYVRFLSTNKTSFSDADFSKNVTTAIGDESRGAHRGSILYIDDISLNY